MQEEGNIDRRNDIQRRPLYNGRMMQKGGQYRRER